VGVHSESPGSLISAKPCSLRFPSLATRLSSATILLCLELGWWGWVPWVGIGSCWACWGVGPWGWWLFELSWKTTRLTISCLCERRSSRTIVRLIGISEGERDKVWLSTSLVILGWPALVRSCWRGRDYEICIRSLSVNDWQYWVVLSSGSSVLLDVRCVGSVPQVLSSGSCCWP